MRSTWNLQPIKSLVKEHLEERFEAAGRLVAEKAKADCPVGQYEDDGVHNYWSTLTGAIIRKPGVTKGSITYSTNKMTSNVDAPAIQEYAVPKPDRPNTVWIGSSYPIMTFIELGTIKHWIEPVVAKALKWVSGGRRFFSKGHWHPGTQPNPVLMRALLESRVGVEEIFSKPIEELK